MTALAVAGAVAVVARATPPQAAATFTRLGRGRRRRLPGAPSPARSPPTPGFPTPSAGWTARGSPPRPTGGAGGPRSRELAEQYVYGEKPAKPQSVTGTVTSTSITVNVSHNGRSASFSAGVQLPSGAGPFPAVIVLGGFGADTTTIRAAGAAVISYDPLAVGREGTPRNNKQGAFYTIYGSPAAPGCWSPGPGA